MAYVVPTVRADGYVVDAAEWNKNTVANPIALKALVDAVSVGGVTTQVQFNDAGVMAGDAGLTYNKTTDALTLAGQLILTGAAAGQIVFPSSQNASTNVNTLDDYEEGAWTPIIGGSGGTSGQSYTTQIGKYVKIGKIVHAYFYVVIATLGTVTTSVQIQGLPFTAENTANQFPSTLVSFWSGTTSSYVQLSGNVNPNSTVSSLFGATAAATSLTGLAQADLSNSTTLAGVVSYAATA